jgi:4,5-dihydroxyphthalate decarboxylase
MKLRCSFVPSALTKPIIDRTVSDPDLDLEISTGTADPNSRRMLAGELDFAEMSLATCVQSFGLGTGFVAMPVFMSRRFLQSCVLVNPSAPILRPSDLAGKRVGIPQYWATSSVWHRALLNHEYGVDSKDVSWIGVMPERLDGYPPGVRGDVRSSATLAELLMQEAVDAVMEPRPPTERYGQCLFADSVTSAIEYYDRTSIYPVIHTVAMQRSLVQAQPTISRKLRALLDRAKAYAYTHYDDEAFDSPIDGLAFRAWRTRFGDDPFPYGIEPNARSLDAFMVFALEQGLTASAVRVEDIFVRDREDF